MLQILKKPAKAIKRKLLEKMGIFYSDFETQRIDWFQNQNIKTVVDVGANTGQSAEFFRKALPYSKIYSFEPNKDTFRLLLERTKGWQLFYPFNVALGGSNGHVDFFLSNYSPSSSLLDMGALHKQLFPHTANITKTTVEECRLDSVFENITLEQNVLFKIDVQGYENRVLSGAAKTLGAVSIIVAEILFEELYENQASFLEIYEILRKFSFVYKGSLADGRRNPKTGLLLFEDAVFVKSDVR